MTAWQLLAGTWPWEPSVVLGCGGLVAWYLGAVRMRPARGAAWFLGGVLVLLLALDSPLDTLADTYLFSAHMAQHLLLILIVPPLLLMGLPRSAADEVWRRPDLRTLARALGRPAVAWALGIGTMWVWHVPALYNAALANGDVHVAQHLSFLVTSVIFWWPILTPLVSLRLRPPAAMCYLFTAALASSLLGVLLTFTPVGLYPAYLHPADALGIEPLVRGGWGLSPDVDQQVGGLLMWIPGGLVYLCVLLGLLIRWYQAQEGEDLPWRMV